MYMKAEYRVPLGYSIQVAGEEMDIADAERILTSRKHRRYSYAIRNGHSAALYRHIWICPCGARLPAYAYYLQKASLPAGIPKIRLEAWSDQQLSLFGDHEDRLTVHQQINAGGSITCPVCGNASRLSSHTRRVVIEMGNRKLTAVAELQSISDILQTKWLPQSISDFVFPLYESVSFNLRRGTVCLMMKNSNGHVLAAYDITECPDRWNNSLLLNILLTNKTVYRQFRRSFAELYRAQFPFRIDSFSPESYILLTRFIGYPEAFYYSIPFSGKTLSLDRSFRSAARILHDSENMLAYYSNCRLPDAKTIRKLIYENPAFLFYPKELAAMWDILKDVNLLRNLLTSPMIYDLLGQLHQYPGVLSFYVDYQAKKGSRALLHRLKQDLPGTNYEAIVYASMSKWGKEAEQKHWTHKYKPRAHWHLPQYYDDDGEPMQAVADLPQVCNYSVPMVPNDALHYPFYKSGIYQIRLLKSRREFIAAGEQLHNCLGEWHRNMGLVFVTYEGTNAVAAIEVDNYSRRIRQVRTTNNRPVRADSQLGLAILEWSKHFAPEYHSLCMYEFRCDARRHRMLL